ncbi:MAG: hypothetical protein ACRD33_07520, partial [Candidatus Acidiferrales bacterium]
MNSGSKLSSPNTSNRLSQGIAFAAILLAGFFVVHSQLSLRSVNAAPDTAAPKTTEDGVYTAAQAAHG